MKIALALSGLPRLYKISIASWSRFVGRYQPDIYIHSWAESNTDRNSLIEELGWIFNPVQTVIEDVPEIDITPFPDRHWPYIDVYRSLSMWKGIWNAHQMVVSSGNDYDIIVRGRFDFFARQLDLMQVEGVAIPYCPHKLELRFNYLGIDLHGLNDHMAYGPRNSMDVYANTYNEILPLYNDGVDYCPENFLTANLIKSRIPVVMQAMEHKLIRY